MCPAQNLALECPLLSIVPPKEYPQDLLPSLMRAWAGANEMVCSRSFCTALVLNNDARQARARLESRTNVTEPGEGLGIVYMHVIRPT
jgi:hypothetical protein